MSGRTATINAALSQAVADRRRLLAVSRPATWAVAAVPFVVGALDAERGLSMAVLLGAFFFTLPFGLLRHGLLDLGGGSDPAEPAAIATRAAIAVIALPLLVLLVLIGGAPAGFALLLTVAIALADGTPPLRLRSRPGLDLAASGLLFALPAACGLLLGGREPAQLPWGLLAALAAWGMGTAALASLAALPADAPIEAAVATRATVGPRATAAIVGAAYGLAALLAAGAGPLGIHAAIGVALFLLPALTILAAGPPGDRLDAAARRAWGDLRGLVVLVSCWFTILLLQHWSITTYAPWTIAILVPSALVVCAFANVLAIRLATRRHRVRSALSAPDAEVPSLTVVVPCHDDIASLPAGLAALRAQTYPDMAILVVDTGSGDGTADEAAAWIGGDAVVTAPPGPDGWTARAWACQVGADEADSDLVLFLDPAMVLAPIAVRVLVEQFQTGRHPLLVGLPRDAMPTPAERASVPGFALLRDGFAPVWWTNVAGGRPRRLVVRDGPMVLARRTDYLESGGHRPRPDGGGLTATFADAGRPVRVVRMASLAALRRFHDIDGVVAAWRRGFVRGRSGIAGAIAVAALMAGAYLVPMLLAPVAALSGADADRIVAAFVPMILLVVVRILIAIVERQPPMAIAWHPVTILLTLMGQGASIIDHVLGRDLSASIAQDHAPSRS